MRRVFLSAFMAAALSGCGSVSLPGLGGLTSGSAPPTTIQLESNPPGAEAQTSTGQSCRTPCAVSVPAQAMTVTFTLDRHQQQTVSLQPVQRPAIDVDVNADSTGFVTVLEPGPVYAELTPVGPVAKKRPAKRSAKRAASAPPPPIAAAEPSPFPEPARPASPFPAR